MKCFTLKIRASYSFNTLTSLPVLLHILSKIRYNVNQETKLQVSIKKPCNFLMQSTIYIIKNLNHNSNRLGFNYK